MYNNELYHYGVPGMRWGHRKAQPISAERRRYNSAKGAAKSARKGYNKAFNKAYGYSSRHPISQYVGKKAKAESNKRWNDAHDKATKLNKDKAAYKQAKKDYKQTDEYKAKRAKAVKVGAAAAGTALAAYGAYKASNIIKDKAAKRAHEFGREEIRLLIENDEYRRAIDLGASTDSFAKELKKSTLRSAKYLHNTKHAYRRLKSDF